MRHALVLLMPMALMACSADALVPSAALGAASLMAVPVFGRTLPDAVYSGITGKDCSAVRLEQGKSYCRKQDPPVALPPVCSRSLGLVECWANPEAFQTPPRQIADQVLPTADQEAWRTRNWPGIW